MNKLILLGIATTLGAAKLAFFPANPPVDLQPTSPGTAQTGHLNITGTATVGLLKSQGTVFGASTAPTGFAYGGFFTAASNQGRGFYGFASSPTGLTYGGFFQNASESGRAVYGLATSSAGFNYGGYFQTASNAGRGLIGVAASATGTTYGVYGTAVSPTGYALYADGNVGVNNGNVGIGLGTELSDAKLHVRDSNSATLGSLRVTNGTPVRGVPAAVTRAVTVQAANSGPVVPINGYAESSSGLSYAVRGLATGLGVNYGIWGSANYGTENYAGYFSGLLYATSSSSGVKSFMIDHPLDPENKVLTHSSVESNERMNLYRGVVRTDTQGYAWIAVPAWFDALNTDIQYQLTVVDTQDSEDFVLAKVVAELRDQRFKIRTSKPRTKICWQVSGRRHDPVSEHYPLEVERMKTEGERGKYYEPEAYGKDKSLGMGYMEEASAQQSKHSNRPLQRK